MDDALLISNSYRYDHNGNYIQKETKSGITTYGYDSMNRLEQVCSPYGRETYRYDYADNQISREWFKEAETGEQLSAREEYEYDERNRLIRSLLWEVTTPETKEVITEYTYDNQGNLLSDGNAVYTYDAFNRMEKAELQDGQTQINRYDAEGLRHEMEENGKLVQFLYSGKEVAAEIEAAGNIIRYIRGHQLVSSDSEKAKTYYHYASDEQGSVTHILEGAGKSDSEPTPASEGKILNSYTYDAFGNTMECEEQVHNRFRYNGEQYDPLTGQYYLRARFYNPVIARFTQEDTYYGDGLNLYQYCGNNPIGYVDPSGYAMCPVQQNVFERYMAEGDDPKTAYNKMREELGFSTKTGDDLAKELQAYYADKGGLDTNLLDELANSGVKYNLEDIVAITKTADGKLVWLENGTDTAGLNHIITEHADDCAPRRRVQVA